MNSTRKKVCQQNLVFWILLMCKIRPTENENLLTPKRGASAYKQVWEQVPSSRRIIEDTNKFLNAIKVISDHEGRAVAGLGTRNGHRNAETKLLHCTKKLLGNSNEFSYLLFVYPRYIPTNNTTT